MDKHNNKPTLFLAIFEELFALPKSNKKIVFFAKIGFGTNALDFCHKSVKMYYNKTSSNNSFLPHIFL